MAPRRGVVTPGNWLAWFHAKQAFSRMSVSVHRGDQKTSLTTLSTHLESGKLQPCVQSTRFSGLSVRGSAPRFPTPPGHAPPLLTPPRPRPLRFPPPFPSAPGSRLQAPTRFVGGGSAQARLAACRARSSGAERAVSEVGSWGWWLKNLVPAEHPGRVRGVRG